MTTEDGCQWAIVELMGHRTRAGAISDAQMGGATLLRIEHPSRADHTGVEPLCEYYAASALFSVRPCSREDAEKVAAWAWPAPTTQRALPSAAALVIDGGEDDWSYDDAAEVEFGDEG